MAKVDTIFYPDGSLAEEREVDMAASFRTIEDHQKKNTMEPITNPDKVERALSQMRLYQEIIWNNKKLRGWQKEFYYKQFLANEKNIYSVIKARGTGKSFLLNYIAATSSYSEQKIAVYNVNKSSLFFNKEGIYAQLNRDRVFNYFITTRMGEGRHTDIGAYVIIGEHRIPMAQLTETYKRKQEIKINKDCKKAKKMIDFKSANAIKINDLKDKIFGSEYDLVLLDDFAFYNKEKREAIITSMKENKHTKFIISSSLPDNNSNEHLSWQ